MAENGGSSERTEVREQKSEVRGQRSESRTTEDGSRQRTTDNGPLTTDYAFMQIQLEKTLDVEVVEGQLAELWKQIAGETSEDDVAVMRARVANLLVFVTNDSLLNEVHEMMLDLTAIHPSRVLMMLGLYEAPDRDIEMSVESYCQTDKRTGARRLCCEEVILNAQGSFVSELPSAALPLLVSDLSTFLWWRHTVQTTDKVFGSLLRAADRLVIDSAEFADTGRDLDEVNQLFTRGHSSHVGISDLNWARLTSWRGLLADFYDVAAYETWLDNIDHVRVDYVGPERDPESVAPQALLIAGWLASRLGWELADDRPIQGRNQTLSFNFMTETRGSSPTIRKGSGGRAIKLGLNRVDRGERKPGTLAQVELSSRAESGGEPASFVVARSADNLHLLTEAKLGASVQRGRVLPVRNRSAAQLLSREMEILCNDQIYEEAVAMAARMIDRSIPRS
jgi:glucose-6-phosphate dehydrogenase assembly protein OpcA